MGNAMKAKGTRAETAIVGWLKDEGFPAKRKVLAGSADEGDIEIPGYGLVIQSKWRAATPTLGDVDRWLAATLEQAANASFSDPEDGTLYLPVLVHNRPRNAKVHEWVFYAWSPRHGAFLRLNGEGFLKWLRTVADPGEDMI